ncbi:MAG: DUF1501 domain-containing protein [Phycisphaera sp.]|nr:DUF1501 domain-containing protein [Phycisphaera sp.]
MNDHTSHPSRRHVIRSMVGGSVLLPGVLSEMLAGSTARAATASGAASIADPLAPRPPHFAPRAKRVIFMYATGGVSHIDTFDPKSTANGRDGNGKDKLMGSQWAVRPNPRCGTEITDLFPHLRQRLDDVCVVRSLKSAHSDHTQATLGMHTGSASFARPSMGSWVSYGLGTLNANLPSFIVIAPNLPYAGTQVYANNFLPAYHQGTRVMPGDEPIANLRPRKASREIQRMELGLIEAFDRGHLAQRRDDGELAARIKSFETAFAMQAAGPEAFDVDSEPEHIKSLYGLDRAAQGAGAEFAWQCLVARRLAERGVRFIELIDTGSRPNWDSHGDMKEHERLAANVDQPMAALLSDLKQRGMLDETLVVWATEFGRTPKKEGNYGRGHHGECFSVWLAGGGIRGGMVYGRTDDIGSHIAEKAIDVHDLHATILHLMGLNHEKLTYRHAGRDFRLTDVYGNVVNEILA